MIKIWCNSLNADREAWCSDRTLEAMEVIDSKCGIEHPPFIDEFKTDREQISPGGKVHFVCEAHDSGPSGSEYLIFKFDINGDGTIDHEEMGVLVDPSDDPFRGKRSVTLDVMFKNHGIYEANCRVENDRGEETASTPITVSVTDVNLSVVGRPNIFDDFETAVIPPDDRFPAGYYICLMDGNGEGIPNETLNISIDNASVARLEGGLQSGSEIEVTTDDNGEASFKYIFLDQAPHDAPLENRIRIENAQLNIAKVVTVSVGLRLRVTGVVESWASRTQVPHELSMRIQMVDAFRPNLDITDYVADLSAETGRRLGVMVDTRWLNKPDPRVIEWIKSKLGVFQSPPDNKLYNGRGWIKKIEKFPDPPEFIIQAIDSPLTPVGPNILPTISLNCEGLHIFEIQLNPIILPEEASDPTIDFVKSAPCLPFWFGTDVYGAESVFQSLVCSFQPTDAQQFVARTVLLENPLLATAHWAGAWAAGTAFPAILFVVDVADLLCDFMQGNILNVGAALGSKYMGRLDELKQAGKIKLTDKQEWLLKKGLQLNSTKKLYGVYNDSVKHFFPKQQNSAPMGVEQSNDDDPFADVPDSLTFSAFRNATLNMNAGLMISPEFDQWESIAVLGKGQISIDNPPEEMMSLEGDEENVFLLPSKKGSLSIQSTEDISVLRFMNNSGIQVALREYEIAISDENALISIDFSNGDILMVDLGIDGSIDGQVTPVFSTFAFLPGDIDLNGNVDLTDALLALTFITNKTAAGFDASYLPLRVDTNGDGKIGLEEVIYILKGASKDKSNL